MLAMFFFNVKESPIVFYALAGLHSFSFQDLILQFMQSFRIVSNTASGKQDLEMMDSSMHLFLLEIKSEWL